MLAPNRSPTSGLAHVTIRAPHRRLDLAIPHQVPLIDLLPELVRRAGELDVALDAAFGGEFGMAPLGGWSLRRGDGATLLTEAPLAHQGVRDGDVLYLVPDHVAWPEPVYDDVVEEIADAAQAHGRGWDAAATRAVALVVAALVLLAGVGLFVAVLTRPPSLAPGTPLASVGGVRLGWAAVVVALALLAVGGLLSRAGGDGVAGAVAAGFAMSYAGVGAALIMSDAPAPALAPDQILLGASAAALAAVAGALAVGCILRVFVAGVAVSASGVLAALLSTVFSPSATAAVLAVTAVGATGLTPLLAVRLGRLPIPIASASPAVLALERRPERSAVLAAVNRADEILLGVLLGIAGVAVGCNAVLAAAPGPACPALAGLASGALLLRARLFPTRAGRLPLLAAGVLGLAVVGGVSVVAAGAPARWAAAVLAVGVVLTLFVVAVTAPGRPAGGSPYLARLADILDVASMVALVPVACVVIGLFGWVRGLVG